MNIGEQEDKLHVLHALYQPSKITAAFLTHQKMA
jgi:hypothetical protein